MKKKNFKLYRGDDFQFLFRVEKDHVGINISDSKLFLQAKENIEDESPVISLELNNGLRIFENSIIEVTFKSEVTKDQEWKYAFYDLQLVTPTGVRKTILRGRIKLIHDITRR